jgi:hypothetical protein
LPQAEYLIDSMEDLQFVELLCEAQFGQQQLGALLGLQVAFEAEAAIGPDLAASLAEVRAQALRGMSRQEAYQGLGPRAQALQQAQARLEQFVQRSCAQLGETLSDEQRETLVWVRSPARGLQEAAATIAQARGAPDVQWQQFRDQAAQGLAQLAAQADPGTGTSPDAVGALLDEIRGLDEAEFEARRPTLAWDWTQTLMPNLAQRLQDPEHQKAQLGGILRHLVTYRNGRELVQARMDALAEAANQ